MKKLLIASTALVASAGFASADVTLGGSANAGVKYNGGWETKSTRLHYEIDFDVIASGTTDGGLTFGASVDLDAEISSASGQPNNNPVKDPEVFISGDFGTLTVGNLDVAADDIGMKDVGFDGIGIDDAIDNIIVMGTDNIVPGTEYKAEANASYRYTAGGFTGILMCIVFMSFSAAFLLLFRGLVVGMYTSDPSVTEIAISLLLMAAVFQVADGVQIGAAGALRGYRDTRMPMVINTFSYWVLGFPLAYLAAITYQAPPAYIWAGFVLGLTVAAVLLTARFNALSKRMLSAA